RVGKPHAVDNVVQPRFENLQKVVAGNTAASLGFHEVLVKLAFHYTVKAAHFLLFTQLQAKLRWSPRAPLPMLARRIILRRLPLHNRALRTIAARTLQIKFHPFSPAQAADGTRVSRHSSLRPPLKTHDPVPSALMCRSRRDRGAAP